MGKHFISCLMLVSLLGVGSCLLAEPNNSQTNDPAERIYQSAEDIKPITRSIEVNIPSKKLLLVQGSLILREYSIGVGRSENFMTPIGEFKVSKMFSPKSSDLKSQKPNAEESKHLCFLQSDELEYVIEGTDRKGELNKFASHGNIKMASSDMNELCELVDLGTPLNIKYNRVSLNRKGDELKLTVYPDPYKLKTLDYKELEKKIFDSYKTVILREDKLKEITTSPIDKELVTTVGEFKFESTLLLNNPYQQVRSTQGSQAV